MGAPVAVGGGIPPSVTHYVFKSDASPGYAAAASPKYVSVQAAITAASAGDTVLLSAENHEAAAQITIDKSITVRGASMSETSYTNTTTGNQFTVIVKKAGAVLSDMTIKQVRTNTSTPINIQRESYTVDASGCSMINVTLACSTAHPLARCVSINGVSNVTITNCVFPAVTAGYTIGLASVRGAVISGCTIPTSAWGSIGIFASAAGAFGTVGSLAADQLVSSGIDFSNNTWTGTGNSGLVNIQPSSYASYKLAGSEGEAAVTLPASFKYAYLMQKRNASNVDSGAQNASISNVQIMANVPTYTAFQASAGAGNHLAMFGRNLETGKVFYDATFNNAENRAYGGADIAAAITAATPEQKQAAIETAANSALNGVDFTNLSDAEKTSAVKQAATAVISAAGASSNNAVVTLIEGANTAFKAPGGSIVQKAAVAEAIENLPAIELNAEEAASFLETLKPENKSDDLNGQAITIVPAKSVESVTGEVTRYILKSIANGIPYEHTPMIPGPNKIYNLLLSTEVDGAGVPAPPVDAILSQLTYVNDKLYFRASSSDVFGEIKLGGEYFIRRGTKYTFKVDAIGSVTDKANGTLPCIPAGQRILTATGWRAVEDLKNGDLVITDSGAAVPANIYSSTITTNSKTAPINIPVKGGNGVVRLSPNHAVRLNKSIWQFPCHLLTSRAGVTQDAPGQKVTYYHIALPNYLRDNLVLEGGIVAESYGVPFMKANATLKDTKIYTYNARLDGFTRVSYGVVASKKA